MVDLTPILPHMPAWLMVLFRLTGIFVLAPVLGSATVPRLVKITLAVSLSLVIYPVLHEPGRASSMHVVGFMAQGIDLWTIGVAIALELLIGFTIGLCASLPLMGIQMGGHLIEQQMGLGFANIINPELNTSSGVLSQFYFLMALTIFLTLGGLEVIFGILMGSFETIPLGGITDTAGILNLFIGLISSMFDLALRVAAPLLCLIFAETLAMGFIARTVPQMNILSVGFIIRILVGTVFLLTTVAAAAYVFENEMARVLKQLLGFFAL